MLSLQNLRDAISAKSPLEVLDQDYTQYDIPCELNFIGDLHGSMEWYKGICRSSKYTIQVGDLINSPDIRKYHIGLDPNAHKYIHGNHDWLPGLSTAHYLGLYGIVEIEELDISIGFISGAYSVDRSARRYGYLSNEDPIHDNEELSYEELESAVELMKEFQPDIIVTHTAPMTLYNRLNILPGVSIIDSRTSLALDDVLEEFSPSLWVFGHFHENTHFIHQERVGFACIDIRTTLPFIK
jgi:predicted phosphohydrolase